ncbi:MAG: spore coat protein CotJB [Bacilli bacterium]|nr:spore coat protein CotJB [Bacilli bacterium]
MYQYNSNLEYYNYDNNNYNKPLYTKDVDKNELFDPYSGLIRGTMFKNLYNSYRNNKIIEINPKNEKEQLQNILNSLCFSVIDISLYLDIYPNDKDIIEVFDQYLKQDNAVKLEYENKYGPLFVNSLINNKYPWTWNKGPWPWEN